ncbi:MAG: hypothetical protein NTW93_02095 [Phycisphaerae bacterium]|nr:hypothetical protein [Phycisphaerae bacterium]
MNKSSQFNSNMKTFGKILKEVKQTAKSVLKFVRDNSKPIILMACWGAGAYLMNENISKANAGVITIKNNTATPSIGTSTLTLKNIVGANELIDIYDSTSPPSPYANALEIYTNVEGNKLGVDARPVTTSGWDFDLAVKGSVNNIDNYLRYRVIDANDLFGKTLTMYDKAIPDVKYTLLMDGAYHNISLPNLTHGTGEYAHWRLGTRILCDLNEDGIVNFKDFSILALDWGNAQGQYVGDISGPNEIPDGYVDYYDLSTFHDDYLKDVNDPNTW